MKSTISISDHARALAEKRAHEEGFETIEAYLGALIEEDQSTGAVAGWMRARLEEGIASPPAGELTRSKFDRLVNEGINNAKA